MDDTNLITELMRIQMAVEALRQTANRTLDGIQMQLDALIPKVDIEKGPCARTWKEILKTWRRENGGPP